MGLEAQVKLQNVMQVLDHGDFDLARLAPSHESCRYYAAVACDVASNISVMQPAIRLQSPQISMSYCRGIIFRFLHQVAPNQDGPSFA